MSDEVYQGDNNSEYIIEDIVNDLDLFEVSMKYKKLWELREHTPTHLAILLLIFKEVSHSSGSKIMEKIEQSIGKKDISCSNFTMNDKKLKDWGISSDKIIGIKKILKLSEINGKTLCNIKEGGIYLVKAFKIFNQEDDDMFFIEDYNVRLNLGILFNRKKPMTKAEALSVSKHWKGFRSHISYFLYRLSDIGAYKIVNKEDLQQCDFHGKVS
jgi:hypothetical protein